MQMQDEQDNRLNLSINQNEKKRNFDTEKLSKLTTGKYTPLTDKYNFNLSVVDQWVEIRTKRIPHRRAFHSAWIFNDYLYIFGGLDISNGKLNDFHRIQLSDEVPKWEELALIGDTLPKISYASSSQYKNEFYVIGGQNEFLEQMNTIYRINPTTLKSIKMEFDTLPPIENHSSAVHEDGIYIFGGFSKGQQLNDLFFFNPESKSLKKIELSDKSNNPSKRINSSIEVYQNFIYLFGGKDSDGKYLNDLWRFDIKSNKWEEIVQSDKTLYPKGRSGHTLTLYNGDLYIFAGKSGNIHENNDFWKFNLKKNCFEIVQDNLLEQHTETKSNEQATGRISIHPNNVKKPIVVNAAQEKLNKEKQAAQERKNKLFEEYLFSCFPPASVMNASNIYEMDCDNFSFKKVMATLVNKSNENNFVSIVGKVPLPRDGHTALVYRKFLVVFGGDRNRFPFNDLYTFMY